MKYFTQEALMNELCKHCDSHIEMCEDCGMKEILKGVPSAWIKCSERLPEPNEHVLVCCDLNGYCISGSYMCVAFRTDDMTTPCDYDDNIDSVYDEDTDEYYFPVGWWEFIKNWDDYSCVAISDTVTHWMPLPDAPGVEDDE